MTVMSACLQPVTMDLADLATPYLDLDVDAAVANFEALRKALGGAEIHYAVKANPDPVLLQRLCQAGASFDVASPAEVQAAIEAGATPAGLVHSNPVKRRADVVAAYDLGVRLFVVDSVEEVQKVATAAPGSSVLCRLVTSGEGSDWPLSRKFGCGAAEAVGILRSAAALGLEAAGVSFHVGSQQRDPGRWVAPIVAAARVFRELRDHGLEPTILDIGGGFPARHEGGAPDLSAYGRAIGAAVRTYFPTQRPRVIAEPGRGIAGDAGAVVSTVIGVIWRGSTRWVYLDAGVFSGLVETLGESIRYRLETSADGGPTGPAILAGPTCDSADVMYEDTPVQLPLGLAEGDIVRLLSAGAYTTAYSTVGFNGFAPMATIAC